MGILDNRSSHKSPKAAAILNALLSGVEGPIEMAFAKLKAHLRKAKARTIDALWKAVGLICELYSSDECWNSLKAAGYGAD